MSSRQQEKEKRREERLAAEKEAARVAARSRRMQMAGGGLLAGAAIVGIVVAIAASGGSNKGAGKTSSTTGPQVAIPAPRQKDLAKASAAAGCQVKSFPLFGREHTTSHVVYKTNPPTSGPHYPVPASDGIYDPGNEPAPEHWVHALEHGRIILQYRPGTPTRRVKQLETLFNENVQGQPGYHTLLIQNNTHMPFAIAASAWQHYIGCPRFDNAIFDALRDFRTTYVDKAPEQIPGPE
jgi:hypothetical protein